MGSNNYTKNYSDNQALTAAMLDAAYQSLTPDLSNTTQMTIGSTSGQVLTSNGAGAAAIWQTVSDPLGPFALRNYGLSAQSSSGTLKVNLLTNGLVNPSGGSPVDLTFSTNGTASATYSKIQVTNALNLTISASATLGFTGTSTNRIYIYALNNGGTPILGVAGVPELDNGAAVSTTAMSASADTRSTLYATAALSVTARLLGWVEAAMNSSKQWQAPSHVNVSNNADIDNVLANPATASEIFSNYTRTVVTGSATAAVQKIQVSNSSGNFSGTTASFINVTNMVLSVTASGKPIRIKVMNDFTNNGSCFQCPAGKTLGVRVVKDGVTPLGTVIMSAPSTFTQQFPPYYEAIDKFPSAGTHTYQLQAGITAGGSAQFAIEYCILEAEEIN